MNEQQVLASIRRNGWVVTARRPDTRTVPEVDNKGQSTGRQIEQPTGSDIWDIASPDGGQVDSITVKGRRDHPDDPLPSDWTVVKGPTKEVPATSTTRTTPTASESNEAELNNERSYNAVSTKWGRVTHAEKQALEARERTEGRQLTNDERNATLAQAREDRAIRAEERTAANQADSNAIARERLRLEAQQGAVKPIGNRLVNIQTGQVVYEAPEGFKFETAQDGSVLAIDPTNPTNTAVIWSPQPKAPQPLAGGGQRPTVTFSDPVTGELTARPDPGYVPPAQQRFQDLFDGISHIEGMLSRGEMTPEQGQQYITQLRTNFDASLRGTTPYQEFQDREARRQARMQSGAGLLNQRV